MINATRKPNPVGRPRMIPGDDSDPTRERLLVAAEELLASRGFAGTSVRAIAASVGIANASLMYHFPSKRRLYAAVLTRIADSIREVTAEVGDGSGDPAAQIRAVVHRLLAWTEAHPDYLQIIVRELMENPNRIADAHRWPLAEFVAAVRKPVEHWAKGARGVAVDPTAFVIHLIGAVSYFAIATPTLAQVAGGADAKELAGAYENSIDWILDACFVKAAQGS